jgi:hypothetical protein
MRRDDLFRSVESRSMTVADLERREREAYEQTPDDPAEFAAWDEVVAWPENISRAGST